MEHTYLKNTPLQEALLAYLPVFDSQITPAAEQVPVTQAAGRITAEAIYARLNVPHYLACAMDGIAVLASDTFGQAISSRSYCQMSSTSWSTPAILCRMVMMRSSWWRNSSGTMTTS